MAREPQTRLTSQPILGLTLFGTAPVEAGTVRDVGPCRVETFSVGFREEPAAEADA